VLNPISPFLGPGYRKITKLSPPTHFCGERVEVVADDHEDARDIIEVDAKQITPRAAQTERSNDAGCRRSFDGTVVVVAERPGQELRTARVLPAGSSRPVPTSRARSPAPRPV
jgi:hypothetical protein